MRFECEAEIFQNFLEKIRADEFSITVDELGLHTICVSTDNIMVTKAELKKEAFTLYPEINEDNPEEVFTIQDCQKLIKYIARFSGKVAIEIDGKHIIMATAKKQADVLLGREELVEQREMPKKVDYDKVFKIKAEIFSEAIKNSDLVKTNKFELKVLDGMFSITTKTQTDKLVELEKVDYPDKTAFFGMAVKEIISPLEGEIEIGFDNNSPLVVKAKDKYSSHIFVLAPHIEDGTVSQPKEEEKEDETIHDGVSD